MVGIEFNSPTDPYTPSASGKAIPANMASRVQAKCLEQDMLTLTTSVYQCIRCVRFHCSLMPPQADSCFPSQPSNVPPPSATTCTFSNLDTRRFIPPLNISAEEMKKGCEIIRKAITDVVKEG